MATLTPQEALAPSAAGRVPYTLPRHLDLSTIADSYSSNSFKITGIFC